jgi:hypothetical protein
MADHSAAPGNDATWRTLLGPCDDWRSPVADSGAIEQAGERCEVCRGPIGADQPFITNSSGQRATHVVCLGDPRSSAGEQRVRGRIWSRLLQTFARGSR